MFLETGIGRFECRCRCVEGLNGRNRLLGKLHGDRVVRGIEKDVHVVGKNTDFSPGARRVASPRQDEYTDPLIGQPFKALLERHHRSQRPVAHVEAVAGENEEGSAVLQRGRNHPIEGGDGGILNQRAQLVVHRTQPHQLMIDEQRRCMNERERNVPHLPSAEPVW